MDRLRYFLLENFDAIITVLIILSTAPIVIPSLYTRLTSKAQEHPKKDELKEELQEELNTSGTGKYIAKKCASVFIYIPFIIVDLLILCGIHNLYILFAALFLLIILIIAYTVKNTSSAIILLSYTDASPLFTSLVIQTVFHVLYILLSVLLKRTFLSFSSIFIPISCWIGGAYGLFSFIRLLPGSKGKKDVLIKLEAGPLLTLAFTQSLAIITSWIVGGSYFIRLFGYYEMDWYEWIHTILFYQNDPITASIRYAVIGSLAILAGGQLYLMVKAQKFRTPQKLITKGWPSLLLLLGIAGIGLYISKEPNYFFKLSPPLTSAWKSSVISSDYFPSEIDHELMVFPNGAPLYTDINSGILIDYSVEIVNDFSGQPYLRFYGETLRDGCVSIWVENQGGLCAENCKFKLTDLEKHLKRCFRKEDLTADVEMLPPGARQCLFTLKNENMVVPEYSEIPLTMVIESAFYADGQKWRMSRSIPGEILLSLRGVTIRNPRSNEDGQLAALGEPIHLTDEVDFNRRQTMPRFYCNHTSMVQVSISIITGSMRELKETPVIFIYEC